jgi:hypothetical protein
MLNVTGVKYVGIFTQHFPTEFVNSEHYLKDDHGHDVLPEHTLPEAPSLVGADWPKPWADALGASFIVNLITFSGVVFLVPFLSNQQKAFAEPFKAIITGACLATQLAHRDALYPPRAAARYHPGNRPPYSRPQLTPTPDLERLRLTQAPRPG